MSETYRVDITADEALLLDGRCSPAVQAVVELARQAIELSRNSDLSPSESKMVAEIVAHAKERGELHFAREYIPSCPCCGRSDGYYPVKRNTKFKIKGQPDHDRPKLFTAWDFSSYRVRFKNRISIGFCESCRPRVEPVLVSALSDVKAQLPEHWDKLENKWKKYDRRQCQECGWEGNEGQMGKLPAIMGGEYFGQCPKCGAKNLAFGPMRIKPAEGFDLVEV